MGKIQNGCITCGEVKLKDLSIQIEIYGEKANFLYVTSESWQISGETLTSVNSNGDLFTLKVKKLDNAVLITPSIKINSSSGYKQVLRYFITGFIDYSPRSFLYNEPEVQLIPNKALYGMGSQTRTMGVISNQEVNGAEYVAFTGQSSSGVMGVCTYEHFFSGVRLNQNGKFYLDCYPNVNWYKVDTVNLNANEEILLDTFAVICQENALTRYGEIINELNGNRKRNGVVGGWCSWYYYGPAVSEKIVLENMAVVSEKNLPLELIQIDDGWQILNGDWDANEKFPSGMKALADTIKNKGYIPGIWVAPFLFDKNSSVVKNHPDWFVYDWDRYFIDYSVLGAQEYLYNLFTKLSKEWGYKYIKVDLIDSNIGYTKYSKQGFTPLNNVRKAYEIIRSAVGEDTHILACTTPLGVIAGLADSVRCSIDIFERWESLKNVAIRQLKRLYVNGYANLDPDCLMLRKPDGEDAECYRPCVRNDDEINTFITYISVTAGITMISDKLTLLKDSDFDKLKTLFPLNKKPCLALDLYENEIPSVFKYEISGIQAYALINWQDKNATFTLKANGLAYAYKFWAKEAVSAGEKLTISLPPHHSEIIYISNDKADFKKFENSIMGK